MESILKSDIFFVITAISVITITIVFVVAGIYLIKTIRNFYQISKILKNYTKSAEVELRELGEHVRQSPLFTFLFGKKKVVKNEESKTKKV